MSGMTLFEVRRSRNPRGRREAVRRVRQAGGGRCVEGLGACRVFKNQAFDGSSVAGVPPAELTIVADVNQYDSTTAIIEAIAAEAAAKAGREVGK